MATEAEPPTQLRRPTAGGSLRSTILLVSIAMMIVGGASGPLFTRIYFLHGGGRLWLTSLLQSCGFPILLLPLLAMYLRQRAGRSSGGVFSLTAPATAASVAMGVSAGVGAYMYAYGSGALPVSTSSLLSSTQLAFTAVFAFLVVRQRFTAYSINAVVLLVMGPVILGLRANGDRPAGESDGRYYLGFFLMLGAAALIGLLMPLIELTCKRMRREVTPVLVMEMQVAMAASATVFCVGAMFINNDFQAISREAKEYGLGETKYYLVLAACAIAWQLSNMGFLGVIFCSSSLLAGVVMATLLPVGQVVPVLVLHEKFSSDKAMAMVLSTWGFASYLYGEYRQHKKKTKKSKQLAANEGSESPAAAEEP